jgi:hypothetical protein
MTSSNPDKTAIATQLLSGMLSNPHIYATISDAEAKGQQERILVSTAVMMAEQLIEKVEASESE